MKKSLISLAVAAAIAAPVAAFADSNVVVYGVANVSADSVDNGATAGAVRKSKISSNTSRLGFKGSEDLGDGLSAIWQVESLIQIDNSGAGNGLATRNTFAGLSSTSVGTVIMGRHDTPYKIATRAYDVFGDGIADNRSLMGGVAGKSAGASFDGRQADVIAYISPAMAGFTGIAGFVQLNETTATAKANAFSLAGMYKGTDLPLTASLSYEEHILDGIVGVAGAKENAIKAGASFAIDALTLAAVYEKTSDNFGAAGANNFGHKAVYASAKYAIGMGAVKAAYTQAGATAVGAGAKQWTLGYDHGLSKRTVVYGLYTKLNNNGAGVTAASYGLSTNGTGANNTAGNLASAPSAFSFGVKHSF
jgi:predicted porin